MASKLQRNNGVKISLSDYFDAHENEKRPSKSRIKELEKELSRPHLIYDNIALTDDYIIAMDANGSPNGAFTSIKYGNVVWLYIGEIGNLTTANFYRVLSLAIGNVDKKALAMITDFQIAGEFIADAFSMYFLVSLMPTDKLS